MTLNEEERYGYVIKFVRDWYSVLIIDYQVLFCYGYLSAMMERINKLTVPDIYEKYVAAIVDTYGFTKEQGEKVVADWPNIVKMYQEAELEDKRNIERIDKERENI